MRGKFISTNRIPTALDTVEFTDYIERIRQWAAEELSVTIPDPQPLTVNVTDDGDGQ